MAQGKQYEEALARWERNLPEDPDPQPAPPDTEKKVPSTLDKC